MHGRGIKISCFLPWFRNMPFACQIRPQHRHVRFHHCAQCFVLFGAHCVCTEYAIFHSRNGWPKFRISVVFWSEVSGICNDSRELKTAHSRSLLLVFSSLRSGSCRPALCLVSHSERTHEFFLPVQDGRIL